MIADLFGTLLPVSGRMRGLPSMSLSIPPTLNSGDVRDVNLLSCKPTVLVLTYRCEPTQLHWCFWAEGLLGVGKWERPLFPNKLLQNTSGDLAFLLKHSCSSEILFLLWSYLHFVSIDKMNASVLNPALGKLWSEWKMGNFHPQPHCLMTRMPHFS